MKEEKESTEVVRMIECEIRIKDGDNERVEYEFASPVVPRVGDMVFCGSESGGRFAAHKVLLVYWRKNMPPILCVGEPEQ